MSLTSRSIGGATAVVLVAALIGVGCRDDPAPRPPGAAVGDPAAGARAIDAYGCGSCHTIPGVSGADAHVGPPLTDWSRRTFIAGTVANDLENLVIWLQDPDSIRPGTAMPDLDVTEDDARNMAAYLMDLG